MFRPFHRPDAKCSRVFDDPLFLSLWSCKGCFPYGNASGRGRLVARAAVWAALFSPIQFLAHLELTTNEKLAFFHRPSSQQDASSRTFSSASCFSVESHLLTGSAACLPSCQIPSRVGRGTPSISSKLRKRCLHFAFSNGLTPRRRRRPSTPSVAYVYVASTAFSIAVLTTPLV